MRLQFLHHWGIFKMLALYYSVYLCIFISGFFFLCSNISNGIRSTVVTRRSRLVLDIVASLVFDCINHTTSEILCGILCESTITNYIKTACRSLLNVGNK